MSIQEIKTFVMDLIILFLFSLLNNNLQCLQTQLTCGSFNRV